MSCQMVAGRLMGEMSRRQTREQAMGKDEKAAETESGQSVEDDNGREAQKIL
jgi:hypothetical protein